MPSSVLRDTNIVIALFAADVALQKQLQGHVDIFIPSIAQKKPSDTRE